MSESNPSLAARGLSQKKLCEYFGWDYKTIAREARRQNLATHEYLIQKTGWTLSKERYYPPDRA